MRQLPPIFAAVRFSLPKLKLPNIVLHYTNVHDIPPVANDGTDSKIQVSIFEHFWVEIERTAMLVKTDDEGNCHVEVMGKIGKKVERHHSYSFNMFNSISTTLFNEVERSSAMLLMCVANDVYNRTETPAPIAVDTKTRNEPASYNRVNNTIRYERMSSLRSAAGNARQRSYAPPDEPSGIRKMEHDVRGHWRTYRSGIRVWVNSHKRGDPALGTTIRVIRKGGY